VIWWGARLTRLRAVRRAIVRKGCRNPVRAGTNRTEAFTLVSCFNVLGYSLTPAVLVHREKGLSRAFMAGCGELGAAMAKTESCMQTQESLLVWLDWFAKKTGAHPQTNVQLLKLDGHSSRDCAAMRERGRTLGVEIFQLPGHVTSRMCEVDTHLAAPFKRRVSLAYTLECCRCPSRETFPLAEYLALVLKAYHETATKERLSNAFNDTGFYCVGGPKLEKMLSRLPKKNAVTESQLAKEEREKAAAAALTLMHARPRAEGAPAVNADAPAPKKSRKHNKPLLLTAPEYEAQLAEEAAAAAAAAAAAKAEKLAAKAAKVAEREAALQAKKAAAEAVKAARQTERERVAAEKLAAALARQAAREAKAAARAAPKPARTPAGLQTQAAAAGERARRSPLDCPPLGLGEPGGAPAGAMAAGGTAGGGRRGAKRDYAAMNRGH